MLLMVSDKRRWKELVQSLFFGTFFAVFCFGFAFLSYRDTEEVQLLFFSSFGISIVLALVCTILNKEEGVLVWLTKLFSYFGTFLVGLVILNGLPFFRTLHTPLVPDVRLNVVKVETLASFEEYEQLPNYVFLILDVEVQSVWGAWGVEPSPTSFELIPKEKLYVEGRYWNFPGVCDYQAVVPINGTTTCKLAFQVPKSLNQGTLRFDDREYFDEVEINF